jgi:hypothetical protein
LTTAFGVMVISGSKMTRRCWRIDRKHVCCGVIELGVSIPLFIASNKRKMSEID